MILTYNEETKKWDVKQKAEDFTMSFNNEARTIELAVDNNKDTEPTTPIPNTGESSLMIGLIMIFAGVVTILVYRKIQS